MIFRFLLPIVFLSAIAHAQSPVDPTLGIEKYKFPSDSLQIKNLYMLSKIDPEMLPGEVLMPLDYNWTRDVRLMESIKRMSLDTRRLDANGREIPIDIIREVYNEVVYKSILKPN